MIPEGIIFPWIGQHANIPSRWTRETSLDGKYVKGWGAEPPNTTGGAITHTHTSSAHYHTIANHTHDYTLSTVQDQGSRQSKGDGVTLYGINGYHYHTGTSGSVSGGNTSSDAVTYGSCSNDPPYYEVIYIKAQAGAIIPNDLLAYFDRESIPDNWYVANGDNSTPDLRDKYLKGASAGADSGATGGSTTNTHDISHSHTANPHSHLGASSGSSTGSYSARDTQGGTPNVVDSRHAHTVTLDNSIQNINSYSGSLTPSETVEPLYKKLLLIQKKAGGIKARGIIGLWLGSANSIPRGWLVCDGNNGTPDMRDYYPKVAQSSAQIGQSGGSNTHTHSAQSHTHTSLGSHTHTGTVSAHVNERQNVGGGFNLLYAGTTEHTISSVTSVSANYNSATTTANSSNNEPPYRTAIFVKYVKSVNKGALLSFLF